MTRKEALLEISKIREDGAKGVLSADKQLIAIDDVLNGLDGGVESLK